MRNERHARVLRQAIACLILLVPATAGAQSRLEQLESVYQSNLRTLHAPVLQDYLRSLERLKNEFIARNRASDARHVDVEIARVKNIVSTTGVLPYSALQAGIGQATGVETPQPAVPSPGKKTPAALPAFLAAEASNRAAFQTKTGAIPLGAAEWPLNKLPAGTYDVLMVYACKELLLPEMVVVNIGGREFKGSLPTDRATGSEETFRLHRIFQVKLDSEVVNGTFSIAASSQDKPALWVRKIMLATPKKQPSP